MSDPMSTRVEISSPACFNNLTVIEILNRLSATRPELSAREVAIATGCKFSDSLELLLSLADQNLASVNLVIYHNKHPDVRILVRDFSDGFPQLPIVCDVCDESITNRKDLLFDISFGLKTPMSFYASE